MMMMMVGMGMGTTSDHLWGTVHTRMHWSWHVELGGLSGKDERESTIGWDGRGRKGSTANTSHGGRGHGHGHASSEIRIRGGHTEGLMSSTDMSSSSSASHARVILGREGHGKELPRTRMCNDHGGMPPFLGRSHRIARIGRGMSIGTSMMMGMGVGMGLGLGRKRREGARSGTLIRIEHGSGDGSKSWMSRADGLRRRSGSGGKILHGTVSHREGISGMGPLSADHNIGCHSRGPWVSVQLHGISSGGGSGSDSGSGHGSSMQRWHSSSLPLGGNRA